MGEPAYERLRSVTPTASVVLADNPSPMTLTGTNTWVLRGDSERCVVVDPGPLDERHLAEVAACGPVEVILLTHRHGDHSDGARRLHELTGAPVRALDPAFRLGDEGLAEGDVVAAAGLEIRVWATPGHTSDSLSFLLGSLQRPEAVLTGDTVLGAGTTVVAHPDGVLADYLASLRRLQELDQATVLPGHGPELASAGVAAQMYLTHRSKRLDQVQAALESEAPEQDAPDGDLARRIVEVVYADVDPALWPAAELSVLAQLAYLRR